MPRVKSQIRRGNGPESRTEDGRPLGHLRWAIAEGYVPKESTGPAPEMLSHETACILNANDREAHLRITIYFSDQDPVGPYLLTIGARRTKHVRFNDLKDPAPVPRGKDYSSVIESDVPIVVQHTRLDSRQAANALLSTIAFGDD
ncbi:MAG TPA: sensory rhodopsin transducer [Candidatus Acidoferrales bacterium]|nr:sensory rhodopsin transducer [Candidatus Acidoferrales bacterium]